MPAESIVVLTGAGVSAESGLPTFRGKDGLWEGHRFEDVACPDAFRRDPSLVNRFYNLRRAALKTVEPNAAHLALARLQREYPGKLTLVTQNVDDLHERGGSTRVIHMHGELRKALCTRCQNVMEWDGDLETTSACPHCGHTGCLRPDIVWFSEIPYHMQAIEEALRGADVFAAIGTSGHVHPAAGFVMTAKFAGARTLEINNAQTLVSGQFDRHLIGPATVEVPRWVNGILTAKC